LGKAVRTTRPKIGRAFLNREFIWNIWWIRVDLEYFPSNPNGKKKKMSQSPFRTTAWFI